MSFDYENRLVVRVPWRCSRETAEAFIEKNRAWVRKAARKLPPVQTLSAYLGRRPHLSIGEGFVRVEVRRVEAGRSDWIFDERRAEGLFQIGAKRDFEDELLRMVRSVASSSLEERTRYLAARHALSVKRVTVRDQTSRWGSCSRSGSISLNWRLILMSPEVRDSVILHELAHLQHLDHSARFYACLDRLDPDRLENEAALHRVGEELMRVGRR